MCDADSNAFEIRLFPAPATGEGCRFGLIGKGSQLSAFNFMQRLAGEFDNVCGQVLLHVDTNWPVGEAEHHHISGVRQGEVDPLTALQSRTAMRSTARWARSPRELNGSRMQTEALSELEPQPRVGNQVTINVLLADQRGHTLPLLIGHHFFSDPCSGPTLRDQPHLYLKESPYANRSKSRHADQDAPPLDIFSVLPGPECCWLRRVGRTRAAGPTVRVSRS